MRFGTVALLAVLFVGAGLFYSPRLAIEEHDTASNTSTGSDKPIETANLASSDRTIDNPQSFLAIDSIIPVVYNKRDIRQIAERKICACLIGMTRDRSIGKASEINISKMYSLFQNEVHQARWRDGGRDIVKDNRCNPAEILDAIANLVVKPDDTLFVYYTGHGAYNAANPRVLGNDPSKGHYFDLDAGKLSRQKLYRAMLKKGARLTVLVSDSCNVPELRNVDDVPPLVGGGPPPAMTDLEKLLLLHRGQVDINSSSENEYAFMDSKNGGWFTFFFHRNLKSAKNWDGLFKNSRNQTNKFYQQIRNSKITQPAASQIDDFMKKQKHQRPSAFRMHIQRAS